MSDVATCSDQLPHILEQTQHLIVGSVVWHKETQVGIANDGGNANETSSAAWNNAHILPRVFARFVLTVVLIVQIRDSFSQWLDSCSRALYMLDPTRDNLFDIHIRDR